MGKQAKRKKLTRAAAAYRSLIDAAVEQAQDANLATRIEKERIYSKAPAHRVFNAFIRSLSAEQRKLLAEMLRYERQAAIHDLFAHWSWWIASKGLGFSLDGKPMPVDLSGEGLHGDFVGRLADWDWPDDAT